LRDRTEEKEHRDQPLDGVLDRLRTEVAEKRIRGVSTASAGLADGATKFGE
jgi:hypothetical protein